MDTARDRALAWLYRQREVGGPRPAAVEALRAAGVLGEEPAEPPLVVDAGAAAELLEELFAAVPSDDDGMGVELNRFEGALGALVAIGAADGAAWEARLDERLGESAEPERGPEGGTERDLVAVLPGPSDEVDGVRLLYALRFTDGVTVVLRRPPRDDDDDFWEWDFELRDDAGTPYAECGASGGGDELRVAFEGTPPADARWIELVGAGPDTLRVPL